MNTQFETLYGLEEWIILGVFFYRVARYAMNVIDIALTKVHRDSTTFQNSPKIDLNYISEKKTWLIAVLVF
jgi:hypothetical protein